MNSHQFNRLYPNGVSDDELFIFCQTYPELNIEREVSGKIIVMSPVGDDLIRRILSFPACFTTGRRRVSTWGKPSIPQQDSRYPMDRCALPTSPGSGWSDGKSYRSTTARGLHTSALISWLNCNRRPTLCKPCKPKWRHG